MPTRPQDARLAGVNAAPLLLSYLKTRFRIDTVPGSPLCVGRRAPAVEAAWPASRRFAVLTAWNPGSVALSVDENARRQHALDRLIESEGIVATPALNIAPDPAWNEPSRLLLDVEDTMLDCIANHFGQAAVVCWRRGRALRLRVYRGDWRNDPATNYVDLRFIDWVACAPP